MSKRITCEICELKTRRVDNVKRTFMAKFPLDEDRCKRWVQLTGKEDLVYVPIEKLHQLKYICGKHFKPKDFKKKNTQLKKNAVPSIDITRKPLSDEMMIGFPLHLFKNDETDKHASLGNEQSTSIYSNIDLSVITREHDYCKSITSTTTPDTGPVDVKRTRSSSPIPSTTTPDTGPVKGKRKRSCSPIPSTTIPDTGPVDVKRKRSSSPIPSTSKSNLEITPRKKKLLKKLEKSKIKIKTLLKRVALVDKLKSPVLKNLILATVRNQNRKPHGKRWTKVDKSLALAIYKKSPKAYRYIKRLIPMPSVRTLQTILQNIKMNPGIYPSVMAHLKKEGDTMSEENKICVLMFDEIALKKRLIYNVASDKIDGYVDIGDDEGRTEEIADHALVFMLQGIRKKFKQPIAHYFVKGTISSQQLAILIKNVVRGVRLAGYTVISTICDQGPTNVGALNLLKQFCGNPVDSNFYVIDKEKVYIIYDVPHLFKSIRNNFLQGGEMIMDNKKAKWCHLIELEKRNKSTLHFKKITKLHVEPKFRSKMKVKLAAQILSNTVAAVLKLLSQSVANQGNSREILETAEVIEDLDRLFDCTNGPSSGKDIKKHIRENVKENSFHHRLWIEYKRKLKTLSFLKSDSHLRLKNVRCVNGYLITIASLQDIWNYVKCKNFKYLNLRQLNQDSLENFFGLIRQHSPTNRNPTCHHFESALKSSVITRLNSYVNRGSNCESDANEILFDFHDIVFQDEERRSENQVPSSSTNVGLSTSNEGLSTSNEDLPVLHIDEYDEEIEPDERMEELFKTFDKQPTVYVSGYLAKVILKDQKCLECHKTMKVSNPKHNPMYDYIALREWWSNKSSLTYPSIRLCETIDIATKVFERDVRPQLFRENISDYCVTVMMTECDVSWMCGDHRNVMSELVLRRLSHLLIRNDCHITNRSFALSEESSADILKKSQQQATAK